MKTQEFPTIRGIISDLDGVAYRGDTAIPSSVRAFRAWHEQGVPYAFVTNNSTKSATQFAAKLTSIGIPAKPRQVFNTISAATVLLARRWPQGTPVFAIGEQALEYLGTAKHEMIMIGDQVATDIAAGNAAGLPSILLASDVPFNAATGVVPDRIVSSLLDLLDATSERAGPLS